MNDNFKVFVCGGSYQVDPNFYKEAYEVGKTLAQLGAEYIQGGVIERETIMGESYYGYVENGGSKAYIITREFGASDLIEYKNSFYKYEEVENIGDLLNFQFLYSDLSIIMPGGTGTFMELLSYIEEKYDYPDKKIKAIIYNRNINGEGFFDDLFKLIKKSQDNNFISSDIINKNFIIVNNFDDLIEKIKEIILGN